MQEIRFALRRLGGHRWFSVAVVLTLAVGIGINTTVFTLVHAVLFKPLPFPNGPRIVTVTSTRPADDGTFNTSYLDFLDLR